MRILTDKLSSYRNALVYMEAQNGHCSWFLFSDNLSFIEILYVCTCVHMCTLQDKY